MKTTSLLSLLLTAGCTATHSPTVVRVIQDSPPVASKPWSDGRAVTYWQGRTTVGNDGSVLHEAHPVYRREDAGQPQLITPPEFFFPPSVPVPSTNAAFEQFEVLRAEAARARDLMLQLTRASEGLAQQAASMTNTAQAARQLQEQWRQLLQTASALSNRVQQLEERLASPARPARP